MFFICTSFSESYADPSFPPIPAHTISNKQTSRSCTTTLQVYKIHMTAFIKNERDLLVPVLRLCLWSRNRFVRFKVHVTVIPTSTIPPDLLDFEFRVTAIRNIKWNKMKWKATKWSAIMYKPQSHYKYHILRTEKILFLWNHLCNSVQFRN